MMKAVFFIWNFASENPEALASGMKPAVHKHSSIGMYVMVKASGYKKGKHKRSACLGFVTHCHPLGQKNRGPQNPLFISVHEGAQGLRGRPALRRPERSGDRTCSRPLGPRRKIEKVQAKPVPSLSFLERP